MACTISKKQSGKTTSTKRHYITLFFKRVFDHELTKSTLYHGLITLLVSNLLLYRATENTANRIQSTMFTTVPRKVDHQKCKSVRDTVERRLLWVIVAKGSLIEAKGISL